MASVRVLVEPPPRADVSKQQDLEGRLRPSKRKESEVEGECPTNSWTPSMPQNASYGSIFPPSSFPALIPFFPGNLPWNSAMQTDRNMTAKGDVVIPVAKAAKPVVNGGIVQPTLDILNKIGENRRSVFVPYKQGDKRKAAVEASSQPAPSKSIRGTSKYRGVTRHRRSGRWEAHIWVPETNRQLYLGGYKVEEDAATAYDIVAIKCKGIHAAKVNFSRQNYASIMQLMQKLSLEEVIMAVRRQSEGFSTSKNLTPSGKYIGVKRARDHFEAFLSLPGSPEIYLGQFKTEEEAAKAVDRSLVRVKGTKAQLNFQVEDYPKEMDEYLSRNGIGRAEIRKDDSSAPRCLQDSQSEKTDVTVIQMIDKGTKDQAKGA